MEGPSIISSTIALSVFTTFSSIVLLRQLGYVHFGRIRKEEQVFRAFLYFNDVRDEGKDIKLGTIKREISANSYDGLLERRDKEIQEAKETNRFSFISTGFTVLFDKGGEDPIKNVLRHEDDNEGRKVWWEKEKP